MIRFILNPVAGKGHTLSAKPMISSYCERRGIAFQFCETQYPRHATALAAEASRAGATAVIAVGGDGTALEVASGLVGTDTPLGIIPLGNGNDMVHNLVDLKQCRTAEQRVAACLDVIAANQIRRIDVVKMNEYYAINIANIGLDAEIAEYASRIKNPFGSFSYILSVIKNIFTYKAFDAGIEMNGEAKKCRLLLSAVCNGSRYGGGFQIAPSAVIDDGLLTVCTVSHLSKLKILVLFPSVLLGKHTSLKEVNIVSSKSVLIDYAGSKKICLDGNIHILNGPLHFEACPKALAVLSLIQ